MTFAQLQSGESVFLDANVFVYDFAPDPTFGPPCQSLLKRIETGDLTGIISSHVFQEVAHRVMTLVMPQCDP